MSDSNNSLVDTIGSTPIVKLNSDLVPAGTSLYIKMESFNPTFSIKDRTAYALIRAALTSGRLKPGGRVVESTSGNLGKSLAMLGAALNFKAIIVVDPKVSPQNLAIYQAFGAEVVMVDRTDENGGYQKTRIQKVQELLREMPDAYWPNQYENRVGRDFHCQVTAGEILKSDCLFDTFVGSVSTGGHLCGIAERLKALDPAVRVVAVDAEGSAIFQRLSKPYLLNGLGLSWRTTNVNLAVIDDCTLVPDAEAFSLCRHLARTSGLLLGGSSGAVIFAALNQLRSGVSRSILCIAADTGWNYLDQFYDDAWIARKNVCLLSHPQLLHALGLLRSFPAAQAGDPSCESASLSHEEA